jgi:hypothetical protein
LDPSWSAFRVQGPGAGQQAHQLSIETQGTTGHTVQPRRVQRQSSGRGPAHTVHTRKVKLNDQRSREKVSRQQEQPFVTQLHCSSCTACSRLTAAQQHTTRCVGRGVRLWWSVQEACTVTKTDTATDGHPLSNARQLCRRSACWAKQHTRRRRCLAPCMHGRTQDCTQGVPCP